jgi:rfaE bifunctional protein kinase chain/domain
MKTNLFTSSKSELTEALDKVQGLPVLVIGDLIVDRYVWGGVSRISAEAPVPVVDINKVENRLGGAGNVANNLKALGCVPTICGIIGDDDEGKELLKILNELGIAQNGIIVDRQRPTSLKTRIIAQRQQMVRIDREFRGPMASAQCEAFAALVDALMESNRAIVISDYGKGVVTPALMKKLKDARIKGRISFPGKPLVIDPHPANYDIYEEACVVKPNSKEAEKATGITISDSASAALAARKLEERWKTSVVFLTLGEDGLLMLEKGKETIILPTVAREVFDVSGAGDTVTAVLSAALAAGVPLRVAGELANLAAGIAVSEVGTVAVTYKQISTAIEAMN